MSYAYCDAGFFLEPQNQMDSEIVFMTCVLLTPFTLLPNGFWVNQMEHFIQKNA